jgi:NhaP-type Na+/H+ or K+/H+ antiporter
VLAQCAARLVRLPSIVLLLATGVALGPEGLAWVEPATLGDARFGIVDFAIAVILFESALNLNVRRLRREEQVIRRLVTWGALVTLAGGALAARFCLGWSWSLSCLFGSIAVVTGPTVVGPLVRSLRLRQRLQTVLEAEGVLIDPIGALLAVLVLQLVLIGITFVILAADVRMADVRGLGWAGLATLGSMMLIVRPLAVYVATRGADLTTAERAFVAGIAPRGIVAAAVASLTAVALNAQGITGGDALRAMVFLLISGTVVLNGLLAWPLARALGLRLPGRNRVAILGAQGLGLSLGRELSDANVDVVFVDADPKRCHVAEEAGFAVVFGDGLQETSLQWRSIGASGRKRYRRSPGSVGVR